MHSYKREQIYNGVYLSSVIDKKFKRNRISINYVTPLDRAIVTNNAVVPFILRKGSSVQPDFTLLNQRLNELYGAKLDAGVSKYGEYQILTISICGLDDQFSLGGEEIIRGCAEIVSDLAVHPNMRNGEFSEMTTEIEKQFLIDTIEAEINDKRSYALSQCSTIMCEGEAIAIKKYGYKEDALEITPYKASRAFMKMFTGARMEIVFTGPGDSHIAGEEFVYQYGGIRRRPVAHTPAPLKTAAEEIKQVTENMDLNQSKLVLGFRAGNVAGHRESVATRLMVTLYGGSPFCKLFQNVREKLSLCYYCSAKYARDKAIMFVDSGVESRNMDRALDEILRQLDLVRHGDFTYDELNNTKLLMATGLNAVTDSLGGLESWYMMQAMDDTSYSPGDDIAMLSKITRDDIVKAAQKMSLDTIYFLRGEGGGQ